MHTRCDVRPGGAPPLSTCADGLASRPTSGWDGLTIYEEPRRLTGPGRFRGTSPMESQHDRHAASARARDATGSVYSGLSLQRPRADPYPDGPRRRPVLGRRATPVAHDDARSIGGHQTELALRVPVISLTVTVVMEAAVTLRESWLRITGVATFITPRTRRRSHRVGTGHRVVPASPIRTARCVSILVTQRNQVSRKVI